MPFSDDVIREAFVTALDRALREDAAGGDLTSRALKLAGVRARGVLLAKEDGVLAGALMLPGLFQSPFLVEQGYCREDARIQQHRHDGDRISPGGVIADIEGDAATLLVLERSLLNLLSRACGVATLTARFVEAVSGAGVHVCDTRKTMPGLRVIDKYAVRCGGGVNHRLGLDDEMMLKENHFALAGAPVAQAVAAARAAFPDKRLTCEVESLAQAREALACEVDCLLLDDFSLEEIRAVAALRTNAGRPGVALEVSGGVTLGTVRAIAETGVERVSIGALTHSAPALDMSFKIHPR